MSPDASNLACATLPWRDGSGRLRVAAVVQATYALRAGGLAEPASPLPLAGDASRASSGPVVSDRVPLKLHADVLLEGRVEPRAAGAAGATRQVVGFAVARGADVLVQRRLVAVGERLVDPEAPGRAAAFGPIAPSWGPRARFLAAEHAALLDARPLALPGDFDLRFFQSAPPEQWSAPLRGGERILLVGLRPEAFAVVCRLPALHAFAQIDGPGARRRAVPLVGDTLWIDAERMVATVTFRGSIEVDRREAEVAVDHTTYSIRGGLAPCEDVEAVLAEPRAWRTLTAPPRKERAPSPSVDPVTLENESGFAAGTLAWAPSPAVLRRAVIVKGTFDIAPGGGAVTLAPVQEELHGDEMTGDGDRAELDRASDFVPFKPKADVLLRGTAHAAPGQKTALVSLTLGSLRGRVVALAPRAWDDGGIPRPSGPFAPVPLRWAHALGGPGFAANPAGTGVAEGSRPPLLEDPDRLLRARADRPRPAAFGPIAPSWEARRARLGTFDAAWQRDLWPCLPADFDPAYFQAAPPELRCPFLAGDEAFRVESVRPGGGAVEGSLAGVRPLAFVERGAEGPAEVSLQLDTVVIDADAMRVSLTWRGSFEIGAAAAARVTVLRESAGAARSFEDVAALLCARGVPALAAPGVAPPPPARSYALSDALRLRPPARAAPGAPANAALAVAAGTGVFAGAARRPAPPPPPPPPARPDVEAMVAEGQDLRRVDLSNAGLAGIDLSGRDLRGALLSNADLTGARLAGANLAGANLAGARAASACFDGADLSQADLTGALLASASLQRAAVARARFADARLDDARLDGAEGEGTSFVRASLARARAAGAKLPKADFSQASLDGAGFEGAVLDDAKLLETNAPGAVLDEASLADARFERAVLPGASFAGARAAGAVFEQADLTGANLRKADMDGAVLCGATLARADLRAARARGAVFRQADLEGARLDGADLMRASFEGANLRRASLAGANLYEAETWLAAVDQADMTGALLAGTKLAK